jgi:hypothetical protein
VAHGIAAAFVAPSWETSFELMPPAARCSGCRVALDRAERRRAAAITADDSSRNVVGVVRLDRNDGYNRMLSLRAACEDGDRRACVRFAIIIGENRGRRAAWRREHPEVFFYER